MNNGLKQKFSSFNQTRNSELNGANTNSPSTERNVTDCILICQIDYKMTALLYDRPPFVLEIAEITYPGEKIPYTIDFCHSNGFLYTNDKPDKHAGRWIIIVLPMVNFISWPQSRTSLKKLEHNAILYTFNGLKAFKVPYWTTFREITTTKILHWIIDLMLIHFQEASINHPFSHLELNPLELTRQNNYHPIRNPIKNFFLNKTSWQKLNRSPLTH